MYLSFQLGPSRYFLMEDERVEKVVETRDIFAVPGRREEILGVIEFNGILVPVFELRLLLPELFSGLDPLPHLILIRGTESLNAFPAEALETIAADCPAQESLYQHPFLKPLELQVQGRWHRELFLEAIEPHLNIP
jgi:hypothetical protein